MTERLDPMPAFMADPALLAVLDALEAAGGEASARFVGGCVRDALLARPTADIDIATPLLPGQVLEALKAAKIKAVPTGIEHGTVTAVSGGRPFEVTTLRRDVETDGRRAVVAFTRDWAEDAERRDFRLNALYLDREGRLYDPTGGGVEDARAGRIVFVGDPETRIREDYLRILRFYRFLAWYGRGEPDSAAVRACADLSPGVRSLSGERVQKELLKLLAAPAPLSAVRLMAQGGALGLLLPQARDFDRLAGLLPLSADPLLRLASLLPDDAAAMEETAARLRLSNADARRLLEAADGPIDLGLDPAAARRSLYALGSQAFSDRVLLTAAARGGDPQPLLALAKAWERPRLPVGGADLKPFGLEGPAVGRALRAVEAWWIDQDFRPSRPEALERLAEAAREAQS